MKGGEGQFARPLFLSVSLRFFHRYLLLLSRWIPGQRARSESGQEKHNWCLRREREKKRDRVGRREGCATRFRVLYSVFPARIEEGWVGIKESRKMNVSHEHHSLPSFQADSIHLLSIPLPYFAHSFYRALPCYACPFEWKLVSNHRGIPVDWESGFLMDNKGRLVMALPLFRR